MILIPLRDRFGGERDIEIDLLGKVIKRGNKVIDVGAHLGAYTFQFAKLVGAMGEVWTFEPSSSGYQYLTKGFRFQKQIKLHNIALTSKNSDLILCLGNDSDAKLIAPAGGRVVSDLSTDLNEMVTGRTLDSFNLQDISFIKIDTEGHELEVLIGALQTIRASKPVLLIEIFRGTPIEKSNAIWKLLTEFKYLAYCVIDGRIAALEVNQYLGEVESRHTDRSVNFFFIPENSKTTNLID